MLGSTSAQRFIFVIEGSVKVEAAGKQTKWVRVATPISGGLGAPGRRDTGKPRCSDRESDTERLIRPSHHD